MALNRHILTPEVQGYIDSHLSADVHQIAMGRSPFDQVSAGELAAQIAAKTKCRRKLPTWFNSSNIYYPPALSVEQCSSETTALYKSGLVTGSQIIDLTGGFGVDSLYFARVVKTVTHCEINGELSAIAQHNALSLGQNNMSFVSGDGIRYLQDYSGSFDTIYIDPARRSSAGKVFMLKDCTPDVTANLDFLLKKTKRVIIKTAPLLDISAALRELSSVSEVHILSVKNECKELLWIIENDIPAGKSLKIVAVTLNGQVKKFSFFKGEEDIPASLAESLGTFLFEPDAALLKTGAFNLLTKTYPGLKKLDLQTQLYTSSIFEPSFPGRIFEVVRVLSAAELKKQKDLTGNVIVRSYPDKAELLVKKYKIKPDNHKFLIFTKSKTQGNIIVEALIKQHY